MNALRWITREAKRLRSAYPHRYDDLQNPWRDGYMTQASAIYAKKHKGKSPVGKPKKKTTVKKTTVRKKASKRRSKPRKKKSGMGAVNQHLKNARHAMELVLKEKMLDQFNAKTKTAKKKIGKDITRLKRGIHKLK